MSSRYVFLRKSIEEYCDRIAYDLGHGVHVDKIGTRYVSLSRHFDGVCVSREVLTLPHFVTRYLSEDDGYDLFVDGSVQHISPEVTK